MARDKLSYKLTRPEIQKIMINHKYKQIRESNSTNFVREIQELLSDVIDDAIVMLDADSIPISGSLDAQKIRGIAKTFGFSERTNKAQRGGADLVIVKNQRNSLAHGVSTFSDCGRNYNISELERIKDDVIFFLEDILKNINAYINAKDYCIKK